MAIIKSGLDSTRRFTFTTLNGFCFFTNGIDRPQVYDGIVTRNMGIKMNGTAATFVNNSVGGSLPASGLFRFIYVYYNSARNQESGFAPSSAEMTANASGSNGIRISIPTNTSLEPGVDFARVYRTGDSGGVYYYDGQIAYTGSAVNYDSSLADAGLGEALGEVNSAGTSNNDKSDLPPTAPYIAANKSRVGFWGRVVYSTGTVAVNNGNSTVTLTTGTLTTGMDGWNFVVDGDSIAYLVGTIDTGAGTFVLEDALGNTKTYDGSTDGTASYFLYRNDSIFFYSYRTLQGDTKPESFPANNYIPINTDDGDTASGLIIVNENWLLAKRNHLYLLSGDTPEDFIWRQIDTNVGTISHWSMARDRKGDVIFAHESGVYITDGQDVVELSDDVKNIFTGEGSPPWTVTAASLSLCHGVFDSVKNRYLLWVPSSDYVESGASSSIPDKCLVFDFNQIQIQSGKVTIGWSWWNIPADYSAIIKDTNGVPRVYFGDNWGFVKYFDDDTTNDGVGSGGDTRRGTCTSGDTTSVIDSGASFYTTGSGLQGCFVHIIAGTNAGEIRRITTNDGTDCTVTPAFSSAIDTTSVYAIGGMHSFRKTKVYDFDTLNEKIVRRIRTVFNIASSDYPAYMKHYKDFSSTASLTDYIDMDDTSGFHEIRFAANRAIHHQFEFGIHDVDRPITIREVEIDVEDIGKTKPRVKRASS